MNLPAHSEKLVYDLTLEYVKQNNILKCTKEDIPNKIKEIAKISEIIGEAVREEYHNISFL